MRPAEANPMLQRHAFLWQRLRDWLAEALHNHANSLEYRTREQLTPLRIWLTLIENLLRRLILLAASTAKVDVKVQWSPEPKPEVEIDAEPEPLLEAPADTPPEPPTKKSNTAAYRFRLYGIHWPRRTQPGPAPTFTGAAPATATSTQALFTVRIHIRDPLLNVGPRPTRRKKSRTRRSTRPATKRTHTPKRGIDITVDDFLAWSAAQSADGTLGDEAWQEMLKDIERQNRAYAAYESKSGTAGRLPGNRCDVSRHSEAEAEAATPCTSQDPAGQAPGGPEPQPELISTQPLLDRLAVLAELAKNPEKLIQRAARAFARRREIALRLSKLAARKSTGILARSRHLYGTLIPLDAEFRLAMQYFAVSYVECDSS
jgi:hypothetical protein